FLCKLAPHGRFKPMWKVLATRGPGFPGHFFMSFVGLWHLYFKEIYMAWQCTKRHQEALWDGQERVGAGVGTGRIKGQSRWAYHPPPWRRWACAAICMAGMAWGGEAGAQTESAPFVFEGGVLRIDTPAWESDTDYV